MVEHGEKLIFGRYTREECGLPPPERRPGRSAMAIRVLTLILFLAAAGWLGGAATARLREAWLVVLPSRVAGATPGEASALLAKGRMYVQALPGRPRMRQNLGLAASIAAGRASRPLGYYANAAELFRSAGGSVPGRPEQVFMTELVAAGVYAELESYGEALAAAERAGDALKEVADAEVRRSYHLHLANAFAYFLACAGAEAGGDPEKALGLAELAVSSRDALPDGTYPSGDAAILDTLATARFAAGDPDRALEAQSLALGLADSQSLDVYLRHYDAFKKGVADVQ